MPTTSLQLPSVAATPTTPPRRNVVRNMIRWSIAGGILSLLWYFDRLRLRDIAALQFDTRWLFPALLLYLPNYLSAALRLRVILAAMHVPRTFRQVWTWTLDAALGDLVLPVVVGGDLVKTARIAHTANRAVGVAAAVADRATGFLGAILLAGAATISLLYRQGVPEPLRNLLIAALVVGLIGGVCGIVGALFHRAMLRFVARFVHVAPFVAGLFGAVADFSRWSAKPKAVALSVLYAAFGHFCWCSTAWCVTQALHIEVDAYALFPVLALTILANTVSVAGGIGGGLVAFEYLFQQVLGTDAGQGAQVGLAMIAVANLSKLFAIPQLLWGSKTERKPIVTVENRNAVRDVSSLSTMANRRAA